MPHDRNGAELKVGDRVLIEAIVTEISPGDDYCNVSVKTVAGRKPDGQKESFSAFNAAVVVKCAVQGPVSACEKLTAPNS